MNIHWLALILGMIDFDFRPVSYFDGTGPTSLVAKLTYPESQWGDELSIYATPVDGVIFFEIVDFYGDEYQLSPETTDVPLSLQEMIFLIETLEVSPPQDRDKVHFTRMGIPEAESWIYPQLKEYFDEKRKTFGMTD